METSNIEWIQATCNWLKVSSSDASTDAISKTIADASRAELEALLEVVTANFRALSVSDRRLRLLMQLVASRVIKLVEEQAAEQTDEPETLAVIEPETLSQLYDRLLEVDSQAAAHTLQILAAQSDEESMHYLAQLLLDSPPPQWRHVALAVSPLWKASPALLELFFDRVHLGHPGPATLAVLLDLANFSVHKKRMAHHPWREKHNGLNSLLHSLVIQLQKLERQPAAFGDQVNDVQRILADSVALTVCVCDAVGLIGHPAAIEPLREALELSHRRIQTEAAAALARLGEPLGKQRLIALAADPVARLRAVAFAEELEFDDEIDESLRYPQALAESEFAAWLASPEQFGIPPTSLELIDARNQYWPSYDEPQSCFLFRYTYRLAVGEITNVGIAGPATHAFHADLTNFPPDEIYAAFAGWQAEHEEIFEIPMSMLNSAQRREADRLIGHLEDEGFVSVQPLALTFLLGEVALLAKAVRDERDWCAVTDLQETICYPHTSRPTTITPEVVLAIYRGRKLLRTFND